MIVTCPACDGQVRFRAAARCSRCEGLGLVAACDNGCGRAGYYRDRFDETLCLDCYLKVVAAADDEDERKEGAK